MKSQLLFSILLIAAFTGLAVADIAIETYTNVFFEKAGQPYNESVSFTVNCYGYTRHPAEPVVDSEISKVFSFHATAPHYGAGINEDYYMNYIAIKYCDLEGQTPDGNFTISNYSSSPIDFTSCNESGCGEGEYCELPSRVCEFRFDLTENKLVTEHRSNVNDNDNEQLNNTPIPSPEPIPAPVPTERGIWERFICFITSLFGGAKC